MGGHFVASVAEPSQSGVDGVLAHGRARVRTDGNTLPLDAGISGDTTADGLACLNFVLSSQPQPPDLVLICLGGNDMLRGLPPAQTPGKPGCPPDAVAKTAYPGLAHGNAGRSQSWQGL